MQIPWCTCLGLLPRGRKKCKRHVASPRGFIHSGRFYRGLLCRKSLGAQKPRKVVAKPTLGSWMQLLLENCEATRRWSSER
jgi:hypothetical protein